MPIRECDRHYTTSLPYGADTGTAQHLKAILLPKMGTPDGLMYVHGLTILKALSSKHASG